MSYVWSTALNPNHDQFLVGYAEHEACCRNTQQTLMELDGLTSDFQSCSSNNFPIIFYTLEDLE